MSESDRDPGEGVLEQVGDRWRLRFVRVLPHSPEKVWRALTEEEHLTAWFPTTIEGELRAGAPLRFRFRGEELPPTTGEMIECEPPQVLEFTWGFSQDETDVPPEYREERPERSRFELAREVDGCRLTFTTTYDRVGKSARNAAGWHVCFDLLEKRLAGRPPAQHSADRWKPLNRLYTERFGPEAATIGPPDSMEEYQSQGGPCVGVLEAPAMQGEMTLTVTFDEVDGGAIFTVRQEGIPEVIPPEDAESGWRMSLENLARLVEIPAEAGE